VYYEAEEIGFEVCPRDFDFEVGERDGPVVEGRSFTLVVPAQQEVRSR